MSRMGLREWNQKISKEKKQKVIIHNSQPYIYNNLNNIEIN